MKQLGWFSSLLNIFCFLIKKVFNNAMKPLFDY